ncbi:MAG: deoxyuridine 5'-triphosphate nucleotidohydrolase [Lachnospiraceae bacterium]|nr:deoxyuridine 5'-triphosphate nucleotidohydrolase [Lachnospiraceae bacterium]
MNRVAKFEKVSEEIFVADWKDTFGGPDSIARRIYEGIKLPKRATTGSAGYDIYAPVDFVLRPGESIKIPTGIRIKMDEGYVCMVFPRSGLGFKYRLQLNNTVGIIDKDYYYSDNEGHLFIKLTNDTNEERTLNHKCGEAFAQCVFLQFGITVDDDVVAKRNGGLGSTSES